MTLVHVFAIIQSTFNTLWGPMQIEHYTMYPEDKSFYGIPKPIICFLFNSFSESQNFHKSLVEKTAKTEDIKTELIVESIKIKVFFKKEIK